MQMSGAAEPLTSNGVPYSEADDRQG
jgi:hypothetical protein